MDGVSQTSTEMAINGCQSRTGSRRALQVALAVVVATGLLLYAVCLFKNISYPLMWADESMTAVGAERVLQFGYPKVHDGRNIFYDLRHSDQTLGVDQRTDAYIGGAGWGHYYFLAPFSLVARLTDDLYTKTAILRTPFAVVGLAGMLLVLWTGIKTLDSPLSRLAAAALFIVLELPCVTLMLHLREVRYYSLQLLLTVAALAVFAAYHLHRTMRYRVYATLLICLLAVSFLTFSPACVALFITFSLFLAVGWGISCLDKERDRSAGAWRSYLKAFTPIAGSLVLIIPQLIFFQTLHISRSLDEYYHFDFTGYLQHVTAGLEYFIRYDILAFAIAAKLVLLLLWRKAKRDPLLLPAFRLSLLLSLYFVVHILLVSKIPNSFYTRYFVTVQPLLVLSFVLDLWGLWRIGLASTAGARRACLAVAALLILTGTGWGFARNFEMIRGRLYEISHRYMGVLDYVIPYLKDHHEHPERLVIATNYEEMSFVYYLNCRTIIGFLGLNMRSDLSETPDCIINRKYWTEFKDIFPTFLRRDSYGVVCFPVFDFGVNNIPETVHWERQGGWHEVDPATLRAFRREDSDPHWGWELVHYYGTATTELPQLQSILYLRRPAAAAGPAAGKLAR
jgi:hypothetical protein